MSPAMRKGLKRKEQKRTKAKIYLDDDVISLLLPESFRVSLSCANREEKCDVSLPW